MKWYRVNSFYESWRPVAIAARVFCLATITANNVDQTMERTSRDHILLIVGLLICGLGLYSSFTLILQQNLILTDSKLLAGGLFGFLILFQFTVISSLVVNYANGTRTAKFFDLVQKTDKHLSFQMGHRWNYEKDHFQAVVYLVLRYIMAIVFMYLLSSVSVPMNRLKWTHRFSIGLSFGWMICCFLTLGLSVVLLLVAVQKRFAVLNAEMDKHLKRYLMKTGKVVHPGRLIRRFAMMHALLSDIVILFNKCFSKLIMFAMGCCFSFILFATFGMIHTYVTDIDSIAFQVARTNLVLSLFCVGFIFQVLICCNRLNYESHRSRMIVHKAIGYGTFDKTIFKECAMFSQQLKQHSPRLSCGLFEFDSTLYYTMVGSLATYLVILLQFDMDQLKLHISRPS